MQQINVKPEKPFTAYVPHGRLTRRNAMGVDERDVYLIKERANKAVRIEQIEPWPMGDHIIFAACGIPTVAITASNIFDAVLRAGRVIWYLSKSATK